MLHNITHFDAIARLVKRKTNTCNNNTHEEQTYITIVQIIFHFFWNIFAHCGIFENGILSMYTLEGVSSVANFITADKESQ